MLAADVGCNVEDVVTRLFGLVGTQRGDELDMPCPDPKHEDARPSASVNLSTGLWHCFSCGGGGDLVGLGAMVMGKPRSEVEAALTPNTPEALLATLSHRMEDANRRPEARKRLRVPFPHEYADGPLDSLIRRGFSLSTLCRWDVRYVSAQRMNGHKGEFTIYASVGIPIEDERGRVLAWCYRRTDSSPEWQPRYINTSGAEGIISESWFGMRHHNDYSRGIVVVEGALDAMWCDQNGVPALGLMGASMGKRKLRQLTRYSSVTLLCDLDAGGAAAVQRIGRAIGSLVPVRVARYRSWMATDPADLHPVDLELVLAGAVPWASLHGNLQKTRASAAGMR